MSRLSRACTILLAAFLVPLVPFLIIGELPGQQWLSAVDENSFTFAITGASLLAIDILMPIPSSIVGTLMGARLGFLPAWFWVTTGLLVGNLAGYLVGRLWPTQALGHRFERPGLLILLLSRPVPVLAEAMVLLAGAERISLLGFVGVCGLGNAIYALFLAYNGSLQVAANHIWLGLLIAMLVSVAGYGIYRFFVKRPTDCSGV